MKTRTDVLNYLIKEKGFKTYLEIGTQTRAQNFDKINCEFKTCVDPDPKSEADHIMTSDKFFNTQGEDYDIIFIDGDHSHEQSEKDFNNALKVLNKDGVIVFHDALPHNEEYCKPIWCGEVYKTCLKVSRAFEIRTYSEDHGVCVVFPDVKVERKEVSTDYESFESLKFRLNTFDTFDMLIPALFSDVIPDDLEKPPLYSNLSDEEVKAAYKNKTGKKRVSAKVTREDMIKELLK